MTNIKIHLICGAPCSGKSTYASLFEQLYHIPHTVISADSLFDNIAKEVRVVENFQTYWIDHCYHVIDSQSPIIKDFVVDGLSDQDINNPSSSLFNSQKSVKLFISEIKEFYEAEYQKKCPYLFIIHYIKCETSTSIKISKTKKYRRDINYLKNNNKLFSGKILNIYSRLNDNSNVEFLIKDRIVSQIRNDYEQKEMLSNVGAFAKSIFIDLKKIVNSDKKVICFVNAPNTTIEAAFAEAAKEINLPVLVTPEEIFDIDADLMLFSRKKSNYRYKYNAVLSYINDGFRGSDQTLLNYNYLVLNLVPDEKMKTLFNLRYNNSTNRSDIGFKGLNINVLNVKFNFDIINKLKEGK